MGIFDAFGTGDQQNAANAQIAGINQGLNGLTSDINTGNQDITSNFSNALSPFLTNFNSNTAGSTALGNALGLNGASGNAAATAAFENNPGIQAQLSLTNDAVAAQEAKNGQTGSGNEAVDLTNYDNKLLAPQWQSYVQSLEPYLGAANTSAAGVAGVDTGQGLALNQNQNTLANATYGANTSIGNANANADLAGLNASGNILGTLGGVLGAGAKLLPFLPTLSDKRAKDEIEPVGELFDGQTVYRYRYKGDPRHQIGLIAQEVEERSPEAIADMGHGFKGVDYRMATSKAAELGRFLEAA